MVTSSLLNQLKCSVTSEINGVSICVRANKLRLYCIVKSANKANNLGIVSDVKLTFADHIKALKNNIVRSVEKQNTDCIVYCN